MPKRYFLAVMMLFFVAVVVGAFCGCSDQKSEKASLPPAGRHSPGHIEIPAKNHTPPRHVNMLTMIVTNNYIQHQDGEMEFFNYHRYGEIFVLPRENVTAAALIRIGGALDEFTPYLDYRSFFFEGGYFSGLESLREKYPGSNYRFDMTYADGRKMRHQISLPDAPVPPPVRMSVYQDGVEISALEINPDKDLLVRWSPFSDGVPDPNDIMDDLVTIMVDPCDEEGKRVYVSGVPTLNDRNITYADEEAVVPAGTLRPATWHWLNGEFSNVVETSIFDGAPAFSSYMTATYLAIRTTGGPESSTCEDFLTKME